MNPELLPVEQVDEDECPYCDGIEEVEARLASGKTDYIACPHPCHRLASRPAIDPEALEKVIEACQRECRSTLP